MTDSNAQNMHDVVQGGTITWKPVDPYTNASRVEILVVQSHWWTLFYFDCDQTIIDNLGWYNDYRNGMTITQPWVSCVSSPTSLCTSVGFNTILQRLYCTDYNDLLDLSSGSTITKITLNRTANFLAGYASSAWAGEIKMANGVSAGAWRIITRIDLTQKYPINSSPGEIEFTCNRDFLIAAMLSLQSHWLSSHHSSC